MDREKKSMTEAILKQTGILNEYYKAMHLYDRYVKEVANDRDTTNTVEKILPLIKSAEESITRIITVYTKQMDAILEESRGAELTDDNNAAYLNRLKEYLSDMKKIHNEFEPVIQPEIKKEVSKPKTIIRKEKVESIADILTESSDHLDRVRAEANKNFEEAGYTSEDLKNPNKTLSDYLSSVSEKIEEIRAETRNKLKEAGYTENDIREYKKKQV